jgi:hypothetical protein
MVPSLRSNYFSINEYKKIGKYTGYDDTTLHGLSEYVIGFK